MSRNIVITGANRGIGLELAKYYQQQGDKVFAIVRQNSQELDKVAEVVIEDVELTKQKDVNKAAQQLATTKVDILINNAGMWHDDILGEFNYDHLNEQMNVNAFAPMRLTEALLNNLSQGSKVINITSRMGSIADNDSGGRYGYRASKAALNALTKSLAIDLKPQGISVAVLHPGFVQTRMVNFAGFISPEESAQGLATRIEELNLENSGGFWHGNGETLPW